FRNARDRRPQRLDREPLLETEVHGLVHHAHPALAQHAHDLVAADCLPGLQSFLVAHESLSTQPRTRRLLDQRTALVFAASMRAGGPRDRRDKGSQTPTSGHLHLVACLAIYGGTNVAPAEAQSCWMS